MSRVVENDVLTEALKLCDKINQKSPLITSKAKECVNKSYELSLSQGLEYEKRVFWGTFAT